MSLCATQLAEILHDLLCTLSLETSATEYQITNDENRKSIVSLSFEKYILDEQYYLISSNKCFLLISAATQDAALQKFHHNLTVTKLNAYGTSTQTMNIEKLVVV